MAMDIRKVKKLIELVKESGIAELEITEGEDAVRISLNTSAPSQPIPTYQVAPTGLTPNMEQQEIAKAEQEANTSTLLDEENVLISPMVGTFYLSPSPEAKPFIQVGDSVNEGDTLCVIEAMKMMNQILAHKSGTVSQILVENGEAVEFDQGLIVIE